MTAMASLVVAGGGVVGLSVARAAARRGLQVFVLEQHRQVGMETSSRNSEVVHAGIYYAQDSWKARLCVQGRRMLYSFCEEYGVDYKRCGKLIVAQGHQREQLRSLAQRGEANGVEGLKLISRDEAREIEPEVECAEALYSPTTGVVDSHGLMLALHGDAEAHGAAIAFSSTVRSAEYDPSSDSIRVMVSDASAPDEPFEIECDYFVNASGIHAPALHRECRVAGSSGTSLPTPPESCRQFAKGTYFKLHDNSRPFRHLLYPIPEVGGLGIHSTVDLDGNVRFGPDVEWVDSVDYVPDQKKATAFAERIRGYWPGVTADKLIADYCGIRPKITMNGSPAHDFYIAGPKIHGVPNMVQLCGIESPGLTSCLAVAEQVMKILEK